MELIYTIIKELSLRNKGKRGCLENLGDLELFALAYELGVKIKNPQSSEKLRE